MAKQPGRFGKFTEAEVTTGTDAGTGRGNPKLHESSGIVDEKALIDVLQKRRIAGAALDVFEQEPVDPANPLLAMDNVIVTPHSLCWTDECFHNMAAMGLRSIVEVLNGRIPEFLVNRAVLQHARAAAWFRP